MHDGTYDGKFVLAEAIAYAENGAKVKVLTPYYPGAKKHEIMVHGIEVIRFSYFWPRSLQRLKQPGKPIYDNKSILTLLQIPFLFLLFILRIFRERKWADVIHAQWTVTALLALPAKWVFNIKVVATARGSDIRLLPNFLNRFILKKVDAVVDCFGPQPWNEKNKKKFPANYIKLPLIVNIEPSPSPPMDMGEVLDKKPYTLIILYVGRMDYLKIKTNNLPLIDLIFASKLLLEKDIDFHIFYIGGGDKVLIKKLHSLLKENHVSSVISLLGAKLNVYDYMKFCHIGIGGIALNAVSQEFIINKIPQILINNNDNKYMPWNNLQNCIFIKKNDIIDLSKKLYWAGKNRAEIVDIGKQSQKDFENYVVNSKIGGEIYLNSFKKLLQ